MDQKYKVLGLKAIKQVDEILTSNNIWFCLSYGSALGAYREHGFIEWDGDIDILVKRPDQKMVTKLLKENLSDEFKLVSHLEDTVGGVDEIDIAGISSEDMHVDIYPLIAGPDDFKKCYTFMKYCRMAHRILGCKKNELNRLTRKWKIPFVIMIKMAEKLIPDFIIRGYMERLEDKYNFENAKYYFPFANDGKTGEIMESDLVFRTKRIAFEDVSLPVPNEIEEYLRRLYGDEFMTPVRY